MRSMVRGTPSANTGRKPAHLVNKCHGLLGSISDSLIQFQRSGISTVKLKRLLQPATRTLDWLNGVVTLLSPHIWAKKFRRDVPGLPRISRHLPTAFGTVLAGQGRVFWRSNYRRRYFPIFPS